MDIRRFQSGDEVEISRIHNEAFSHWIQLLGLKYEYHYISPNDVFSWISSDIDGLNSIWVAVVDGTIAGYAAFLLHSEKAEHEVTVLRILPNDWSMGQSNLAVSPSFRGMGIALALLDFFENYADEKKAALLMIQAYSDNNAAIRLLEKAGYTHNEFHYYPAYSSSEPIAVDSVYAHFDLSREIPTIHHNDQIITRPANLNDIDDIQTLSVMSATWVDSNTFTKKWVRDYILGYFGNTVLVAEFNGHVVGAMDYIESRCRIGIAGVLPEFRKRGIGYTLFHSLLKAMQNRGLDEAIADTGVTQQAAIQMYNHFAFEIKRRQNIWIKELV